MWERVQVREIRHGSVALTDGRQLPAGFNTFTHGYALTSHSSQSQTVDEVLLVASSRSFAAVNREQFYVSISRGRERCHIFTDDADLLARRVTDSHQRKAAVELQALRDELAKLGFRPRQQLKEETLQPAEPTANIQCRPRLLRPMRPTRTLRSTRLAPMQRLVHTAEDVRRWVSEHLGLEHKEAVAEKLTPSQTLKPKPTLRAQVQRALEQFRQQKNRPSRGYRP